MKVVNLKQAILLAWKERWSDYQWAINIKKNCPKGATWDYLNLAGHIEMFHLMFSRRITVPYYTQPSFSHLG